ncbi:MAG TPA: hypothetical protein VGQ36_06735 [Thermoanaerobaculia bacterium]|nr:hypothetical protein [Thermoanaerobaculia bacterium]
MSPSTALKVIALFCMVWPFLAMASVPRRGRSSAPIAAMLVVLAVILCGVWLELSNVAGAAALDTFKTGLAVAVWPTGWIAILTLVLRHRPVIDRMVIILGALLCVSVFAAVVSPPVASVFFARGAAAMTLAIAIAAAVRLFLVTRASKTSKADPALLRDGV